MRGRVQLDERPGSLALALALAWLKGEPCRPQVVCELEANKWTPSGQAGGDVVVTARSGCRPERIPLNRTVQIKIKWVRHGGRMVGMQEQKSNKRIGGRFICIRSRGRWGGYVFLRSWSPARLG
jgi:hypothetical protein